MTSNQWKGKIGEFKTRIKIALRREKLIGGINGKQVPLNGGSSYADFVVRARNGRIRIYESKFGTSRLTDGQKAIRQAIDSGDSVHIQGLGDIPGHMLEYIEDFTFRR